jgi:putative ABC transport system permease protein
VNERKFKEIGVRKVNGASWRIIYGMLTQHFIKWIIVALVLANIITYFFVERIFQLYEYRTEISWHIFMISGFITILITQIVIAWHSYRSAVMNPVEALRYE